MERHLAQLLTNNDPPSNAAIRELKELLVTPLQELEETNVEIANLEARVKFLKEKRDAIQNLINKYHMILSPVRRINTDILHEVFYHCLPTHRNPILAASEAPVLLTQICSGWRTVALSSPRLWAQLHIIFAERYRGVVRSEDSDDINTRTLRTLKLRCAVVGEWLMRSGTCPLSISIYYSDNGKGWTSAIETQADGWDITMDLFKILLRFSDRWRSLELTMPIETYGKLDAMISNSAHILPMLTCLKLSFRDRERRRPGVVIAPRQIALLKAPRLNKVSLSGPAAQRQTGLSAFGTIPYAEWTHKLTYLCCHIAFSVDEGFNLLKQCGNLVHCKLLILPDYSGLVNPPVQNPNDIVWSDGIASLPHLISLSIIEDSANHGLMAHFYSSLDAPRLKWIDYQRQLCYHPGDANDGTALACPILSLLQKSIELKRLNIQPRSFSSVNLHRALEIVSPTLTHLVLGDDSSLESPWTPTNPTSSNPARRTPFDLEWLVVNQDFEVNSSSKLPRKNILLPYLEILESYLEAATDDTLLRFTTGRMDPSSPNGVAALKRVRIMFERKKEVDVVEEVARYRDEKMAMSGVRLDEVQLDLDYLSDLNPPDKASAIVNRLSPSYGLGNDDQSWNYLEIDESMVPN